MTKEVRKTSLLRGLETLGYDHHGFMVLDQQFEINLTVFLFQGTMQNFVINALAFSPDSVSLAVAQSDCIIFIYRIGEEFKMKKSITAKFPQPAPVTTLIWPSEVEIICGLADGKIRQTPLVGGKGPKSKTAFSTDACVAVIVAKYLLSIFIS